MDLSDATSADGSLEDEESGAQPSAANGSLEDEESGVQPSAANGEETEVAHDELTERKLALERICIVLGSNYKAKLAEFGSKITPQRVDQMVNFLRITRDDNFRQLKQISKEMVEEWTLSDTPLKRMNRFSWILFIKDAVSPDDLNAKSLLSTSWVEQAKEEVASLKKARDDCIKGKYEAKKTKLNRMLQEAHLVPDDVGFDPDKEVAKKDYKSERKNLKHFIKDVKVEAAKRKELVLRVELAKDAVKQATKSRKLNWDLKYVSADLIHNANEVAVALEKNDDVIPYDGRKVGDILTELKEQAIQAVTNLEEEKRKKDKKALADRTRKGTRYKKRDDNSEEDEVSEVPSSREADGQS